MRAPWDNFISYNSHKTTTKDRLKCHTHLIHDHLLHSTVPLCPHHHRLEELDVFDIPGFLCAVDEVLNLCLSHLAAEVSIVTEDLCQSHCLYDLESDGEGGANKEHLYNTHNYTYTQHKTHTPTQLHTRYIIHTTYGDNVSVESVSALHTPPHLTPSPPHPLPITLTLSHSHIISTLQEEVQVPVQQSLVGVVIVTEVLQKLMSQMHDLPHPVVITLQEGMG